MKMMNDKLLLRMLLPKTKMTNRRNNEQHKQQLLILDTVLEGLYRRYLERVPQVQTIVERIISSIQQHHQYQQEQEEKYSAADLDGATTTAATVSIDEIITRQMTIENDHIAFRSLLLPATCVSSSTATATTTTVSGIARLEHYFIQYCGYTKRDYYDFTEKKLNAYWYSPPDPAYPRIFISELRVSELSPSAQTILIKQQQQQIQHQQQQQHHDMWRMDTDNNMKKSNTTNDTRGDNNNNCSSKNDHPDDDEEETYCRRRSVSIGQAIVDALQAPIFNPYQITYGQYEQLLRESEYAAWVYGMNSHDMNHLTIAVHSLPPFMNDLTTFHERILSTTASFTSTSTTTNSTTNSTIVPLNHPTAPIQTSPDGLLLQSSTVATPQAVNFCADQTTGSMECHVIPGPYLEFAERRVLPEYRNSSFHDEDEDDPQQQQQQQQPPPPPKEKNHYWDHRRYRREGFEMSNAKVIFESTATRAEHTGRR